ncbi:44786_t:CDS:1, partial [Gigaspora margarita]
LEIYNVADMRCNNHLHACIQKLPDIRKMSEHFINQIEPPLTTILSAF